MSFIALSSLIALLLTNLARSCLNFSIESVTLILFAFALSLECLGPWTSGPWSYRCEDCNYGNCHNNDPCVPHSFEKDVIQKVDSLGQQ